MERGSLDISGTQRILGDFIICEILLALEESGLLGVMMNGEPFSARTVAGKMNADGDILCALCDFLVEQGLCEKKDANQYRMLGLYDDAESSVNYLLAYKRMYESLNGFLNGSRSYGSDVARNGTYYRRGLDAMIAHSFPFLLARLNELDVRRIAGISANALGFLRAAANEFRLDACVAVVSDEEWKELEKERSSGARSRDAVTIMRGEPEHPDRFAADAPADALFGIAVFHDFRPEEKLRSILGEYKKAFPLVRLFLLEFDVPARDETHERENATMSYLRSVSRLTHALKREAGRRSFRAWADAIERSGWHLAHAERFESGLVIYECS